MTDDPARGVHLRYPWLCHIFGHRWRTFDANWCGTDYQMCQRMGFWPFKICGAVRNIPTAIATEARRAETVQLGSVHESAGRKASPKLHPQTTD